MITVIQKGKIQILPATPSTLPTNAVQTELYGLSTDTKPTNYPNATTFYEMNTKKTYIFDQENTSWHDM